MAREWGFRYLKVDGMDYALIEGYRYLPNITAIESQRMLLQLIRESMGNDVLLEKDGGPLLNSVGLVDFGRVSRDTSHSFEDIKESDSGIAAHYYTHRNFWANDPAYFNLQEQVAPIDITKENPTPAPLTLSEAQISDVLAAISGAQYENSDDLPTLGSEPERLALVTNPDLLQMAKLGRVARPLDLMTYRPEDEQPSIFLLREDERQSMLAVFNWTEQPSSHVFRLSDLGLTSGHSYGLYDALREDRPFALDGETIRLEDQAAQSVKLINRLRLS